MKPKDIVFQLFGQAGVDAVGDVDFEYIALDNVEHGGVEYDTIIIHHTNGVVEFLDEAGEVKKKLALKVELVPIEE